MSEDIREKTMSLIEERLSSFIPFAEQFGKSRFLVYKSEVHASGEKEEAWEAEDVEMEAIADSFRCEIRRNGNTFSLFYFMDERNPGGFLEIVDSGMPPPLVGGDNGTAHNPDGSTYKSNAPLYAYGLPLDGSDGRPDYSKEGTGVIHEIKTMLKDLFSDYFHDAIADSKKEIMETVKKNVQERIHKAIANK